MFVRQLLNAVHVCGLSGKMDQHDGPGSIGERFLDAVDFLDTDRNRLLAQDLFACPCRLDGLCAMKVLRRGNVYRVEFLCKQFLLRGPCVGNVEFSGNGRGPVCSNVHCRHDLGVLRMGRIGESVVRLMRSRDLVRPAVEMGRGAQDSVLCRNPACASALPAGNPVSRSRFPPL